MINYESGNLETDLDEAKDQYMLSLFNSIEKGTFPHI